MISRGVMLLAVLLVGGCVGTSSGGSEVDGADTGADANTETDAASDQAGPPSDTPTPDASDTVEPDITPECGCVAGAGQWCRAAAEQLTEDRDCALPPGVPGDLLACDNDVWTLRETCAEGCQPGEIGGACALPVCPCFVQVSWCGASAGRHGLTLDPPCQVPLIPGNDQDILGCDGDNWIVLEACALGCDEAPTGTPDECIRERTPRDPGWDDCPDRGRLAYGLHPEASNRLRCAGVGAGDISQTIGNAPASAGYHAADGRAEGEPYTAAVDIRTGGLSNREIRQLLGRLGRNGFAAWYRQPGADGWPSNQAPHIHAVFAGVRMKSQLRGQVRDYLAGRNGLASHTRYRFWTASDEILEIVRLLFTRHYTP